MMLRRGIGTGVERLLFAILLDAVCLVRQGATIPSRRNARDVIEARRWLLEDDVLLPFSFLNVTDYLDLDPDQVRDAVVRSMQDTGATSFNAPETRLHRSPGEQEERSSGGSDERLILRK